MDDALFERVMAALRRVPDPELAEGIVDLGLVQSIDEVDGVLQVRLIPTSATCPMAEVLVDDVQAELARLHPQVEVQLDWAATWTPDRMAPALRQRLGW